MEHRLQASERHLESLVVLQQVERSTIFEGLGVISDARATGRTCFSLRVGAGLNKRAVVFDERRGD